MIWPHDMAIYYPELDTLPMELALAGGILLVAVTYLVVICAKRRPYLAVGWFWFVGTLVPVIGLVQVGSAAMADRYTYVPGIGLFIMAAWGVPELVGKWRAAQSVLRTAGAAVLAGCLIITTFQ